MTSSLLHVPASLASNRTVVSYAKVSAAREALLIVLDDELVLVSLEQELGSLFNHVKSHLG